jgi:SAM-dependent methyltransferase
MKKSTTRERRMPQTVWGKAARFTILGKSPVDAYLRLNLRLWKHLPSSLVDVPPIRSYGAFLQTLVRLRVARKQNFGTLFLRNRPQLELMRRLSHQKAAGSTLKIAVLACSKGAEVYSILWTIRADRPDLKVVMNAADISKEVLEFAERGVYSLDAPEFHVAHVFGDMTEDEMRDLFDWEGDKVRVNSWIRKGITWHLGDAEDPEIVNILGYQDVVVANNFLCHMYPPKAENCLRNIARLVKPGGYLVVSGIDLDVRTKVAEDLGWIALSDLLEKIHEGDHFLRDDWPSKYWGLEPLDKTRHDWKIRYASVFQIRAEG